ncbi:hypothetical protein C8R44DRAFT_78106 [Mycena epipterygia]|nr:hypothetical protein C8R44DRAFT_78106 [Mycena epipterygia]
MSSSLNVTVLDQSPTFIYVPDREGSSSTSWQSSWTPALDYDPTHTKPNIASGSSSHVTSLAGATVQLDFLGVGITIYGQGTAGAYSTILDGGKEITGSPDSAGVLASYGGLSATDKHTIILKATKSQTLSLSYATFTLRSDLETSSVVNTTVQAVTVGANNAFITNSLFSTSGSGFSNEHSDQNYTRLDTDSSAATITFTCSNTSALFVYGTTNYNHQTFSVELDPPAGASQGARIFNGTSKWFVLDNLLFFEGGMDPTQKYQVKLENLIDGSYTDIHSVVMMSLPPSAESSVSGSATSGSPRPTSSSPTTTATPSKSSSVAKTAGIAVGVAVAVAALILVFVLCWRRRRNGSTLSLDTMVATPFGKPPSRRDTSLPTLSDTPMNLSHLETPSSLHDPYATNSYATNSATTSLRDLSYHALGQRDAPAPHLYGTESASGSSSVIGSAAASTSIMPGPSTNLRYIRNPEKGRLPSEASPLSRPVRQEVDAGRVPVEEETLPPNYDPTWAN